jgi:hypothetical protein
MTTTDIEDIKHKVNDCLDRLYGVTFDEEGVPKYLEKTPGFVIGFCRATLGQVLEAIERMEAQ